MIKNKKTITESPIKTRVRRLILEGEMEKSESALAAKDLVDRLQDMVTDLGKMSNDELPHLIDAIRGSFGAEAATAFQSAANSLLNDLLTSTKDKRTELETAVLTLTGDATGGAALGLSDDSDMDNIDGENPNHDIIDKGRKEKKEINPLGREPRLPESARKILDAKIIAINEALSKTDKRKKPVIARRLAEDLRRLVTEAIKMDAAAKKKAEKKKKESKKLPFKKVTTKKNTPKGK
jgi:hypothetical protein